MKATFPFFSLARKPRSGTAEPLTSSDTIVARRSGQECPRPDGFIVAKLLSALLLALFWSVSAVADAPVSLESEISRSPFFNPPLAGLGTNAPGRAESELLWQLVENGPDRKTRVELSLFLEKFPNSPWAPSVRAHYALQSREEGRYSVALREWERVWNETKHFEREQGKEIADFVLAHWSSLLANLGRQETLAALFKETANRAWSDADLLTLFRQSREAYDFMVHYPERSFRCGTFALIQVAQRFPGMKARLADLADRSSPSGGFSLKDLAELSKELSLGLIGAYRSPGAEIPIPAVIHWKEKHYAAIVAKQGEGFWVIDPALGIKWIAQEVIEEEGSGYFLVPEAAMPANSWRKVDENEMASVYGTGQANTIDDWKDEGCDKTPAGPSLDFTAQGRGGNNSQCVPCDGAGGMPVWWVTEPYLNVWIADEPLSYQTSSGEMIRFRWTYRDRGNLVLSNPPWGPNKAVIRSVGMTNASWNHNWLSHLRFRDPLWDASHGGMSPTYAQYEAYVYLPDGGLRFFSRNWTGPGQTESRSLVRLEALSSDGNPTLGAYPDYRVTNGVIWVSPSATHGFRLAYPDGSQDIYNYTVKDDTSNNSSHHAFLTRRIDRFGREITIQYEQPTGSPVRVRHLIDQDGRTNIFRYTPGNFHLVSEVEDPYGRKAQFSYDTIGRLGAISDAASLSSSFLYVHTNGWLTRMTTPYGDTDFIRYEADWIQNGSNQGNMGGHDRISRAIQINEPNGGKHVFMFRHATAVSYGLPDSYPAQDVPSGMATPDNGNATSSAPFATLRFRNSFYWGPKQHDATAFKLFYPWNQLPSANDYKIARLRHWLDTGLMTPVVNPDNTISNAAIMSDRLSLQRDPSPDGTIGGQVTWFDYDGKPSGANSVVGSSSLFGTVGRKLPDGETQRTENLYFTNGKPERTIETFTKPDGSIGTRFHRFFYHPNGVDLREIRGPDPTGSANVSLIQFDYNSFHQVTNAFHSLQQTNAFTYHPTTKQITSIRTPAGLTVNLTYYSGPAWDSQNGFLHQLHEVQTGRLLTFTWTNGLVRTLADDRGFGLTNSWDGLNRLTSTWFPDGTYSSNRYSKLDLAATRDRLGNWTQYTWNVGRQLNSISNALGNITQLNWCGCGALQSITDPLNNVTSFQYDNLSRRTGSLLPDGSSLSYTYDPTGRLTRVQDGAGRRLDYSYNNQGLLSAINALSGEGWRITYDERDRPVRIKEPHGGTVTNTFDLLNRVLSRAYPDGGIERFGYTNNLMIAHTNALGDATRYGYDAARRLTATTNANNEAVRFTYDSAGNVTQMLDGKSQQTSWVYDIYGRMTQKRDAASALVLTLAYDANDRIINRWTPAAGNTAYTWDAVGNLRFINYPGSTDIDLTYDALNRLTQMSDAAGTSVFAWTSASQLLSENGPWNDDVVSSTYAQSLRSGLNLQQPGANPWTQTYGYDTSWRLASLTSPAGTFGYSYFTGSAAPLVHQLNLPNNAYITNAFDVTGQLRDTRLRNSSHALLNQYSYGYDQWGQRTDTTRFDGTRADYTYDAIGQLKTARGLEPNGTTVRLHENIGYAYDAANNLQRRTNNAYVQTYNVDSRNRLTTATRTGGLTVSGMSEGPGPAAQVSVNSVAGAVYSDGAWAASNIPLNNGANTFNVSAVDIFGRPKNESLAVNLPATVTFTSDANGNLTGDGKRTFAYDNENQLTSITVANAWRTEFVYDGLGRRRLRKEFLWNGSAWSLNDETRYIYDGMAVIEERGANNLPRATYTRGVDLSGSLQGAGGIGGMLAMTLASSSHHYYHADGGGNITALIDPQQNVSARYAYDPFGRTLAASGPAAAVNRYRYSSKEVHDGSGLYDFGYRFYEPTFQRWLNADPLGEAGGINLYRFVRNSPLKYVDPDGLAPQLTSLSFDLNTGASSANYGLDYGEPRPGYKLHGYPEVELLGQVVLGGLQENYGEMAGQAVLGGTPPVGPGSKILKPVSAACKKWFAKLGDLWKGGAAKTTVTPQYYIQEGVRRSVAVREAGLTEVPATIFVEGQAPVTTTLPINQLFSPKAEIPLNSRFLNIQPPIRVPITVEPLGLPGQMPTTPLPNVKLVP